MDGKRLILLADQLAKERGLSYAEWSRQSGYDEFGKIISNTLKRGDCKLKVMTQLLKPLGCKLLIVNENEDTICPFKECIVDTLSIFND